MADEEQLAIVRQGSGIWNAWRRKHPGVRPDLSGANLSEAILSGANLIEADLSGANLGEADLSRANLYETIFADLDLSSCKGLETCVHQGPRLLLPILVHVPDPGIEGHITELPARARRHLARAYHHIPTAVAALHELHRSAAAERRTSRRH